MIEIGILPSQPQPLPTAAALQSVAGLLLPRPSISALPLACALPPALKKHLTMQYNITIIQTNVSFPIFITDYIQFKQRYS